MYIDKLSDIVNKCSNAYRNTIKMKLVNVKSSTYIDFDKKDNGKDSELKVNDPISIPKYFYKYFIEKHFWKKLHSKFVRRGFYDYKS